MGGGNKQQTQQVQNNAPWTAQQPYLLQAFRDAQKAYTGADKTGYTGDFFAAPRPEQISNFNNAIDFANGTGSDIVKQLLARGGTAADIGTFGANTSLNGLYGLTGDQTDSVISTANRYAENPYTQGAIDAATRDAKRAVSEGALPSLYRNAAAGGNLNSSRTAVAEGVISRGLADQVGDISAQLRQQAYDRGLDLAIKGKEFQANTLGKIGDISTNQQQLGLGALSSGLDNQASLYDLAGGAAAGLQAADQNRLDNTLSKFEYKDQRPFDLLSRYYGVIGANQWGGQSIGNSTVTQKPSTLSTIGAGIGTLGSLLKLCDRRYKNPLAVVGTFAEGIPLWLFTYKDDPLKTIHISPMAQDVQKHFPEAVVEEEGRLYIDFSYFLPNR